MEKELTTEQLALIELLSSPQSFNSIKTFLGLSDDAAHKEINKLRHKGLLKEIKGPTYDLWELSEKGKGLLKD